MVPKFGTHTQIPVWPWDYMDSLFLLILQREL